MDVLSDILRALRLKGSLYFTTEFTRPWGLRVPALANVARFHLVTRGESWTRVAGMPDPVFLQTGDLILVPHGVEHSLLDDPTTQCRSVDEVLSDSGFDGTGALVWGGDDEGAPTKLICGHFAYADGADHPLLRQLPPALVIRWDEALGDSPVEKVFRYIVREVQDGSPGFEAVVQRLSEVLFVQAIRAWARGQESPGFLQALDDPQLVVALSAIHADPARKWTLRELGGRAAMGRSAFAERFKATVGTSPLQYLVGWRMHRARQLLRATDHTLESIAGEVGYESSGAFSRVFKRASGMTPGAYRRGVEG